MKSIFSNMIASRALPLTIYDLHKYKKDSLEWTIPLDQIVIHKSVKKGHTSFTTEKKIEVVRTPKVCTQNECFSPV